MTWQTEVFDVYLFIMESSRFSRCMNKLKKLLLACCDTSSLALIMQMPFQLNSHVEQVPVLFVAYFCRQSASLKGEGEQARQTKYRWGWCHPHKNA
jgi:hypothetical protein